MKNIGLIDRIVRILVSIGLYSLGFIMTDGWQYMAIFGVLILMTALVGVSPLYLLFKISTCKKKVQKP
ncbi:MAG: DUF2892 domain-containing protein [Clostridiaceae bacterium]|nr:DUF2892 domain-containing protein [Clostridiaceae bacterium]